MLLMTRSIFFFLLDDVMMSGSFFQTHFTINKPYEKALTIKKKKPTVAPHCYLNSLYNWFIICYKQQFWHTNTKALTKYIGPYHCVINPLDIDHDHRPSEANNSQFGYSQQTIQQHALFVWKYDFVSYKLLFIEKKQTEMF